MGVWIEINNLYVLNHTKAVTPCVGVWIEILDPSSDIICNCVTPCVGVWIEIIFERFQAAGEECHSLCGSVD